MVSGLNAFSRKTKPPQAAIRWECGLYENSPVMAGRWTDHYNEVKLFF